MSSCTGLCKGDRAAHESPAVFVMSPNGRKVLMCPCCQQRLVYRQIDFTTGAPNVLNGVERKEFRFEDNTCNYDVVVLKDLK